MAQIVEMQDRSRISRALGSLAEEPPQQAVQSTLRQFISICSRARPAPSGSLLLAVMPALRSSA
jgi:hypothetical protein